MALPVLLLAIGCSHDPPLTSAPVLDGTTCEFQVHWPPVDPQQQTEPSRKPLLLGSLDLRVTSIGSGESGLRVAITLRRPATESDREYWNSQLAYADLDWMDKARVWDERAEWLWPNLPYLLRLPGRERVERYGGLDPGKRVDNDFAAVLIRKYDATGQVESAETASMPLVSAEWYPVEAESVDLRSIVHVARSDEFLVHVRGESARGQLKAWLIYADFLGSKPPDSWPSEREFAGGILAYFEIDWERLPDGSVRGFVRQKQPTQSTGFAWQKWVVRRADSDEAQAQARLTDRRR